jgi:imidazole glycerol-phosphate synthase subunit HisH
MSIAVVDYGMGNTGSILNMLRYLDIKAGLCTDFNDLKKATRIILPGVGAFDHGMNNLRQSGMADMLYEMILIRKIPVLGICLGMQLMTLRSTEGIIPGLGWLNASTIGFEHTLHERLRVPHMGWNTVQPSENSRLLRDLPEDARFYFVHSYRLQCHNPAIVAGKTLYGSWFDSVVEHENIFGCQFHPEKSHRFGMTVFKNFNAI